jgi:hypothetical protein
MFKPRAIQRSSSAACVNKPIVADGSIDRVEKRVFVPEEAQGGVPKLARVDAGCLPTLDNVTTDIAGTGSDLERELRMLLLSRRRGVAGKTSNVAVPVVSVAEEKVEKDLAGGSKHAELRPGELLSGRYRICGTLGSGVFATVFRCADMGVAEDSAEPRDDVAVKVHMSHCSLPSLATNAA